MTKKLLLLLPLLLLTACSPIENVEWEQVRSKHWFNTIEEVHYYIDRMENDEVVCYRFSAPYKWGISCFPKPN